MSRNPNEFQGGQRKVVERSLRDIGRIDRAMTVGLAELQDSLDAIEATLTAAIAEAIADLTPTWKVEDDCLTSTATGPWEAVYVAHTPGEPAASYNGTTGESNHPGVVVLTMPGDGRVSLQINSTAFLIGGGEKTEFIFKVGALFNTGYAANAVYMGYCDSYTPVDAVALQIYLDAGALKIRGYNASTGASSTTTGAAISASTWYHGTAVVNSDATSVSFTVVDMAGTVILDAALTTNIPKVAGKETAHGVFPKRQAASGNVVQIYIDYLSAEITREIER